MRDLKPLISLIEQKVNVLFDWRQEKMLNTWGLFSLVERSQPESVSVTRSWT